MFWMGLKCGAVVQQCGRVIGNSKRKYMQGNVFWELDKIFGDEIVACREPAVIWCSAETRLNHGQSLLTIEYVESRCQIRCLWKAKVTDVTLGD